MSDLPAERGTSRSAAQESSTHTAKISEVTKDLGEALVETDDAVRRAEWVVILGAATCGLAGHDLIDFRLQASATTLPPKTPPDDGIAECSLSCGTGQGGAL